MNQDQLNALKQLRDQIDEQIEQIEEEARSAEEEKEEQFFQRVVDLCSKFQNVMWQFLPSSGEDSWPGIRQYIPYDDDALEILEQADAEVRAIGMEDHETDIRIWRHTERSACGHDADEEYDIYGFTVLAPLDGLVELCRAAGLKEMGALDHDQSYHSLRPEIASLQEQVTKLEARAEQEETEWDNLYFGI